MIKLMAGAVADSDAVSFAVAVTSIVFCCSSWHVGGILRQRRARSSLIYLDLFASLRHQQFWGPWLPTRNPCPSQLLPDRHRPSVCPACARNVFHHPSPHPGWQPLLARRWKSVSQSACRSTPSQLQLFSAHAPCILAVTPPAVDPNQPSH